MKNKNVLRSLSLALALMLVCTVFVGCDFTGIEPILNLLPGFDQKATTMHVTLDMGQVRPGIATPLLDSCETAFLDKEQWGLDVFIPGDVYKVIYTGELMMLESYPGRIVLQEGQLVSVERTDAGIVPALLTKQGDRYVLQSLVDGMQIDTDLPQYVILDEQGVYCELSEYLLGKTLYITYQQSRVDSTEDGSTVVYALALYAYLPRK